MTPAELVKEARLKSGLSGADFALALGYRLSSRQGLRQQVWDMENGRKNVTPIVKRLCMMFLRFGVPDDFLFSMKNHPADQNT